MQPGLSGWPKGPGRGPPYSGYGAVSSSDRHQSGSRSGGGGPVPGVAGRGAGGAGGASAGGQGEHALRNLALLAGWVKEVSNASEAGEEVEDDGR